ncbi:MAG: hypothetical protein ACKOSS_09700 [Planctomycetia bacterium]
MTSSSRDGPGPALPASARAFVERTLAGGRISPAYLLEGPDGVSLREVATAFAAALLCPKGRLGCACPACARARSGTHPDLVRLRRDKATVISVAALEPVLAQAHTQPSVGSRRVFIVDPADALEPEGVARYLKTLEEPPPSTTFLLVSTRPERLPDTVHSRCRRLSLPPLAAGELARALEARGLEAARAAEVARAAGGSLERALRIHEDDLVTLAREAWQSAAGPTPQAARTAERLLAALQAATAVRAAQLEASDPPGSKAPDRKGEALREGLRDLLHVVAVEAREAAAGRPALGQAAPAPRTGLDLLARCARLAAAASANVTPSVVLHDLLLALRPATPGLSGAAAAP